MGYIGNKVFYLSSYYFYPLLKIIFFLSLCCTIIVIIHLYFPFYCHTICCIILMILGSYILFAIYQGLKYSRSVSQFYISSGFLHVILPFSFYLSTSFCLLTFHLLIACWSCYHLTASLVQYNFYLIIHDKSTTHIHAFLVKIFILNHA